MPNNQENIVRKWFKIGECIGMHRCDKSVREIARELQLTKSTVGRELRVTEKEILNITKE